MSTYSRMLLLTTAALFFSQLCACSKNSSQPAAPTPPQNMTTKLNGTAVKGLVVGGLVGAYAITDGSLSEKALATSVTDGNGQYAMDIVDYQGPVLIRLTAAADGSTSMVCDLKGGCGDIAFGSKLTISDSSFTLDAVVPSLGQGSTSINISALTDVSSAFALAMLSQSANSTKEQVAEKIAEANAAVADRFGISGVLTSLPVLDITKLSNLVGVSSNVVQYNVLNSAVIEAAKKDNSELTITSAVDAFSKQYVDNGLPDNEPNSTAVSLAEVLAQASALITVIEMSDTQNVVNLSGLQAVIDSGANLALMSAPSDTGSQGEPSSSAGKSELDKAKAFVKELSNLSNNIDMAVLRDDINVGDRTAAFRLQFQAARLASGEGSKKALQATELTLRAIVEAYNAHSKDSSLTSWLSPDKISVAITTKPVSDGASDNQVNFTVLQNVNVDEAGVIAPVAVDIVVSEILEMNDVDNQNNENVESIKGKLWVRGFADTSTVKLTFADTSIFSVDEFTLTTSENVATNTDKENINVSNLKLDLSVDIAQKASVEVTDPVTFTGRLKVSLGSLVSEETTIAGSSNNSRNVGTFEFSLWGSVKNITGDSASISLRLLGDGSGVTFGQIWKDGNLVDAEGESAENYVDANFALSFNADLAGISDAVITSFSISRIGISEQENKFKLVYPGIQMELVAVGDVTTDSPQPFSLTNQDGVVATVISDKEIMGTLYVGIKKVADIKGAVVTYSDGTFGSLDL